MFFIVANNKRGPKTLRCKQTQNHRKLVFLCTYNITILLFNQVTFCKSCLSPVNYVISEICTSEASARKKIVDISTILCCFCGLICNCSVLFLRSAWFF